MEKKQTQRIIGILVVIALIIIIMPLLFGKNDAPIQEATSVNAPPLPDQQVGPSTATNNINSEAVAAENVANNAVVSQTNPVANDAAVNTTPDSMAQVNQPGVIQPEAQASSLSTETTQPSPNPDVKNSESSVTTNPATISSQTAEKTLVPESSMNDQQKNSNNPVNVPQDNAKNLNEAKDTTSGIVYERPAPDTAKANPVAATIDSTSEGVAQPVSQAPQNVIPVQAVTHKVHKKTVSKSVMARHTKSIRQFNQMKSAWAVQMGSFRVKQNAVQLSHKLQAAGFKTFTREIRSAKGISTRVYVGPEIRLATAAKLSNDVHHQFNMRGILVSYKNLEG